MTIGTLNAETKTMTYQAVMQVRQSHSLNVLGDTKHIVGIATFRGLAIFADGEIAVHRYEGWFDLTEGSGKFHGYALWQFTDGSEIRSSYNGQARTSESRVFHVEAEFDDFTGTGRFANTRITGNFSGRRYEAIADGGSTHLRGSLSVESMPR
jgi:hypothetical protein